LLDLTRVRLGTGIPIVRAATPLREFLEEAIAESQLSHPDRTITLSAPTEPLMADVDADRFAQVVGNLLANATAYSPPETAVSVRLRTWEAETFQLEVHNTGQPIPSTVIRTIFDPFKRGDVADRKGLGLGLYIVHAVVNAHAGRIDVESSESHGTTFRIVMPLRAPPEPPSQAEDPRKGT
ncbi:MAG: HAMP domain-containing sensor histidine kinase, partial [Cystobacter sp.]